MYCTDGCAYCARAERLLTSKGIAIEKIRVDEAPELRAEMTRRSGRETVPQIFIGARHIGGFDDLVELDIDGELDDLLSSAVQSPPDDAAHDPGGR